MRRVRQLVLLLIPLLALAGLWALLTDALVSDGPMARRTATLPPPAARPFVSALGSAPPAHEQSGTAVATSDASPLPDVAAAIDASRVRVRGVALLDDDPMRRARLRFVSSGEAREVVTDPDGAFTVELVPGAWAVWPPFAEDERIVGRAQVYEDALAMSRGARNRSWLQQALSRPWLHVGRGEPASDDEVPKLRPGGAVLLRFASPWVIDGRVVDARTDAPLARASVAVNGRERFVYTDDAGAFRVVASCTDVEHGPTLRFEARGYAAAATRFGPARGDVGRRHSMVVKLRRALTLTGRVRDLEGRPLRADVTVRAELPDVRTGDHINGGRWRTTCDEEGRFTFDAIPPGAGEPAPIGPHAASVSVSVRHPEFIGAFLHPVHVHEGAPPLELRLAAPLTVFGRVVDAGGRPIAGAKVNAQGPDEPIDTGDGLLVTRGADFGTTHADGRFVLTQVPARALLLVDAKGFPRTWFEVWLPIDHLELRLDPPAAPIEGRVVTRDGAPYCETMLLARAPGRAVTLELDRPGALRRFEEWALAVELDADGRFALRRLPDRPAFDLTVVEHADRALRKGVVPGTRDVELVAGRAAELRVEVPAAGRRVGTRLRLFGSDGELVSYRELTEYHGDGRQVMGLDPGRHVLLVTAPGFRPLLLPIDAVAGRDVDLGLLRLEPGGGRLELHVTWPAGPAPTLRATFRDTASGLAWNDHLRPPSAVGVPIALDPLPTGRLAIDLVARGHDGVERALPRIDVTLRDGETTTVALDLR